MLVDDVLSSGGTVEAVHDALESIGAELVDVVVVLRRVDVDHGDVPLEVTSLLEVRIDDGEVVVLDKESET